MQTGADSFRVDVDPVPPLALPAALQPANFVPDADGGHLQPLGGSPVHVRVEDGVFIRVAGDRTTRPSLRFATALQDGVLTTLGLVGADSLIFGTTGFGLHPPSSRERFQRRSARSTSPSSVWWW